jgi:hypothetical protein
LFRFVSGLAQQAQLFDQGFLFGEGVLRKLESLTGSPLILVV